MGSTRGGGGGGWGKGFPASTKISLALLVF